MMLVFPGRTIAFGVKEYDHLSGIYLTSCKLNNTEFIPLGSEIYE